MKKLCLVLSCFMFLTCGFWVAAARADVVVQVASTQAPTEKFGEFTKEFFFAFDEFYPRSAPAPTLLVPKPKEQNHKIFYLIERRDNGLWLVGLCEPKGNNNFTLDSIPANLSFHPPIWEIEGSQLGDEENIRKLAREAAKALINKINQKGV